MALIRHNLSLNLMSSKQMVTTEGVLYPSLIVTWTSTNQSGSLCKNVTGLLILSSPLEPSPITLLKIVSVDLSLLMGYHHLIRISGSLAACIYDTMTDIPAYRSRSGRRASCRSRSSVSRSGSGASQTQDTLYKVYTFVILLLHT